MVNRRSSRYDDLPNYTFLLGDMTTSKESFALKKKKKANVHSFGIILVVPRRAS